MKLKAINERFSICKVNSLNDVCLSSKFLFIGKTDNELSVVCPVCDAPKNAVSRKDGFKAFRIEGTLDFSLIGIISKISAILAENKIGVFVVSTFDTDYVLTDESCFENALSVLEKSGYELC